MEPRVGWARRAIMLGHSRFRRSLISSLTLILLFAFPFCVDTLADYDWINTGGVFENSTPSALAYDSDHDLLYVIAHDTGMWIYDGSTWTETGGSLDADVHEMIYVEDRDILYAGTEYGVYEYDGGKWTNMGGAINDRQVQEVVYDDALDVLYAGIYDYREREMQGVWRYKGGSWTNMGGEITRYGISALVYDRSHNCLYAGTYGRGVWRCEAPATSTTWINTGGEIQNMAYINELVCDSNGYLFAGSSGDGANFNVGVWRYDGYSWVNTGGGYFNQSVISLAYDSSCDVLFAGTRFGGIYSYDGSMWAPAGGDLGSGVYELLFDDVNGILYAGVFRKGLWKWTATPTITYCLPPSGIQGQTIDVEITGIYTNFIDGVSQAEFSGSGITLNSTTVADPNHARANITVSPEAKPGPRAVNVITGTEHPQVLAEGFFVERYWERNLYFAEGYTGGGFKEYICLANTTDDKALVEITYYDNGFTRDKKQYLEIPPASRTTVYVNALSPNDNPAIKVASDRQIVAERPMYFDYHGDNAGGHVAKGAVSPATRWYFAEGSTDTGHFEQWLSVLNPGSMGAMMTLTFQVQYEIQPLYNPALISEEKVIEYVWIGPHSRKSYNIGELLRHDCQNALTLQSTQPVIAERSMYFDYSGPGRIWCEGGHCTMGATTPSEHYYFAEGTTRARFDEWLILYNPNPEAIRIDALYHLGIEQGEAISKTYELPAKAIYPIYVNDEIGIGMDVSATLESSSQFLAERSIYFHDSRGRDGGHCAAGVASPSQEWIFAEGYTGGGFDEWLCLYNPGANEAWVELTAFAQYGGENREYTIEVPAEKRVTVSINDLVGRDLQLSLRVISDQPIVAERAMYFTYNGLQGGHVESGLNP